MAWSRDEARLNTSSFTAYSYTECDWEVGATQCSYRHIGGITSPYGFNANATATAQWWESGSWTDYGSGSGTFTGYGDLALFDLTDTFARQAADRVVSVGTYTSMMGASARSYMDYTVPHLAPAVTWDAITRNSDTSITLSWNAPALEYSAMCLEVSIDGGSWSQFAVLWNTATSYTWTGCSADHSYRFRIRTNYLASYSAYETYATAIVMTPTAPTAITTAAAGGTNIDVTLDNPSPVATKVQYQISTDGGSSWGSVTDAGSLTSFTISASGTVRIRVRNWNSTGESAWLESGDIVTICPPDPPTITSPQSNVWDSRNELMLAWVHNPLDGSAQTAYQYRYRIDGGAWTTVSGTGSSSRLFFEPEDISQVGEKLDFQVRTKGADASYSDWSSTASVTLYNAPTLSITSPSATVTGMPISLSATYSDMAGFTCQAATVSLQKDGRTLYSEPATINGTSITASLDVTEFLPTNGESYTIVLTARSSSSLQTSANATFTVDFTEPQAGALSITNDPETGYASLLATFDNSASEVEYSGDTNEQYESTEGYVRSLTVEGKSERVAGKNLFPASLQVNGTNINQSRCTVTLSGDEFSFAATNTDMSFGYTTYSAGIAYQDNFGALMPVTAGSSYTLTCTNTAFNKLYILWWNASRQTISTTSLSSNVGTVTAPSGAAYASLRIGKEDSVNGTTYKTKVQFEQGSTSTEYEPYFDPYLVSIEGVSVGDGTITTPLRSAGSVHDTLTADADSWTVERRVGTATYDGTETTWTEWTSTAIAADAKYYYVNTPNTAVDKSSTANLKLVSTGFVYQTSYSTTPTFPGRFYFDSGSYPCFVVPKADFPTLADFKTWLGTHPVSVNYPLLTPTTDPETSMSTIELGTAFTVATDLDSTFAMTTWDGSADAVSISVSRVNADGSITPLITDGASGSGVVDKYAPLNTPYQYAVTTKASTQAVKTVYVDNEIITDLWFAYWTHKDGENVTDMAASAKWNPDNGGIQIARPQKTRVYYAGRKDPVSYDGAAVSLNETPSWMIVERSEIQPFVQLIEDGGRGVYKSCDGWVYHADFDLTMTPSYTAIGYYGGASLGITRIAGERL